MKLDHLVYGTRQNPEAVVHHQQTLGINVVIGGQHLPWGTQNALLYTANAYIEFLSIDNKEVASQSEFPLTRLLLHDLKQGEGWNTICISVKEIASFRKSILEKGFKPSEVFPGQRKTPEGELLEWKLLFVDKPDFSQLPFPFFIEWNQPQRIRRTRLKNKGAIQSSNEELFIDECIFAVNQPQKEAELWSRLLDIEVSSSPQIQLKNCSLQFVATPPGQSQRLREVIFK